MLSYQSADQLLALKLADDQFNHRADMFLNLDNEPVPAPESPQLF